MPQSPPTQPGGQNEFNPYESHADLIIGIDFGTTFTGVAYAFAGKTVTDKTKIAEKVIVIKKWPKSEDKEKIPTVLSYAHVPGIGAGSPGRSEGGGSPGPQWGKIKLSDEPRVVHFKLGLQENVGRHYSKGAQSSQQGENAQGTSSPGSSVLGGYLNDHNWHHPAMPSKQAVDYCADYLTQVVQYVTQVTLPRQYGKQFLQNQQISYVITVPAIWSDKAKELTRQAAFRAGISRRKLMLITEPEAAALYCATLCRQVDLKVGNRFLICDAGGGTVDLIAYKVLSLEPFSLEESSPGTGAACASIYLDQGFQALLRRKLGDKAESILTRKCVVETIKQFDAIKTEFDPFEEDCEEEYEIHIKGAPEMPEIGLEEGYLKLSKADIQSVFDPVFSQIFQLVQDQITTVKTIHRQKIQNTYLFKYLQSKLKPNMEVFQPVDGISAIMRGAVLYKLGLDFVKDRIMRRSYGVAMNVAFRSGHHPNSRKVTSLDGVVRCEDVMHWYAYKNQKLASGTVSDHPFFRNISPALYNKPGPLLHRTELLVCERDNPPEYYDRSLVTSHCSLSVDLRKLPINVITKNTGPSGDFFRVDYDLGVTFGPGGIEFKFLHDGKVMGHVDAEYY